MRNINHVKSPGLLIDTATKTKYFSKNSLKNVNSPHNININLKILTLNNMLTSLSASSCNSALKPVTKLILTDLKFN